MSILKTKIGEKEAEDSHIDFIFEFERDCNDLSRDIVSRLCKRAIKKMNKLESTLAGSTDDYPSSLSFFDILSVELQTKYYDEINTFSARLCGEYPSR